MKVIIGNVFVGAILALIVVSCNTNPKVEKQPNDGIDNYLMQNLFESKEFALPSYYHWKAVDGKQYRIDSLIKSPQLVFRFGSAHCDVCIKSCIEAIKNSKMADKVIGLASYENLRMLKLAQQKYDIPFPLYFMPVSEQQDLLSEAKEHSSYPYLFLLDSDHHGRYLFSPSQLYPDVFRKYLEYIFEMFCKQKTGSEEIFISKNMDIGDVVKGKSYEIIFEYTNPTAGRLVLYDVKTSCGCMVSQWNKEPLASQKSANLIINFTPENSGYSSKTIMVSHNKSKNPVRLMIRANVVDK